MQCFRIEKEEYLDTMLRGMVGELHSFRWNTRGNPIVYAATSRSLAMIEKVANIGLRLGGIPKNFKVAVITIPEVSAEMIHKIETAQLPVNWKSPYTYAPECQALGDEFARSENAVMFIPSVVISQEHNVLLNPRVLSSMEVQVNTEEIDDRLLSPEIVR